MFLVPVSSVSGVCNLDPSSEAENLGLTLAIAASITPVSSVAVLHASITPVSSVAVRSEAGKIGHSVGYAEHFN